MTAIVGILNKRAAVIAADSALTVNHGETNSIYNDASSCCSHTRASASAPPE